MKFCSIILVLGAVVLRSPVLAQGGPADLNSITVLNTGNGQTISTFSQFLPATSPGQTPVIRFDFGFSTDEAAVPGTFLDAVSLTVQNGLNQSAIFFTADAAGVKWAPATPGNVILNSSGWTITPVVFPGLQPEYSTKVAFSFMAPLPETFQGQDLNFYFDLFDNQNAQGSLGWMTPISVVPEPGGLSLLVPSLLSFAFLRRSRF